jgi:chromosome segregation ATPase
VKVSRFWGAGSFGLVLLLAAAFSARTAGAQPIFGSDPEGLKKTDNLIKKAEDLVKSTTSAREQIGKTLDTYNSIFADDTKDVKKVYKSVEGEMKKTEEKREDVKKQLDEMKVEADAYLASWKASLASIGNADLRKKSEARMGETKAKFDGIQGSIAEARQAYEPFITSVKDQWTYLGHDLNPSGISSLKPERDKLNVTAKELFGKIDASTKKATEYINSIRASRPVS